MLRHIRYYDSTYNNREGADIINQQLGKMPKILSNSAIRKLGKTKKQKNNNA